MNESEISRINESYESSVSRGKINSRKTHKQKIHICVHCNEIAEQTQNSKLEILNAAWEKRKIAYMKMTHR